MIVGEALISRVFEGAEYERFMGEMVVLENFFLEIRGGMVVDCG
jgi:hypothetical protein